MIRWMNNMGPLVATLAMAVAVAGCKKEEPTVEPTAGGEEPAPEPEEQADYEPEPEPVESCSLSTVYFGFDSAELTAEAKTTIESAVDCFRSQGTTGSMHLTGATDPRGTEEYNIALGQRRAEAVRKHLKRLGMKGQVSVSSVGEEMARGTNEAGWSQDRNVSADGQ